MINIEKTEYDRVNANKNGAQDILDAIKKHKKQSLQLAFDVIDG
jgi:hypothetical protein